jgi:HPt (histidine-containing phosphotransfer) domain-containing protein
MNSDAIKVRDEAASAGPFDLVHLEQATAGDRALAREVLALFDGQAERLLEAIAAAADAGARSEAAHTLKGAARGVGAQEVARAAEEIEAGGDDPIEVIGALARLSARVAEARLALAGLVAQS